MGVFRYIANRVYQLWSHSFLRLKRPSLSLRRRINHRCSPWVSGAQRFLLLESSAEVSATETNQGATNKTESNRAESKQPNGSPKTADKGPPTKRPSTRRSTGHALIQSPQGAHHRTRTVTLLAILLLATCLGQRFYRQPGLDVRAISPQTFYAPASAVVEDTRATELRRDDVRNGSVQVLKIDQERTAAARKSLDTLLRQGRELREQAGRPNFLNLDTLSQPTQDYLFQASETDWKMLWRLSKISVLSVEQLNELENKSEVRAEPSIADRPVSVSRPEPSPSTSEESAPSSASSPGSTPTPKSEQKTVALPSKLISEIASLTPGQRSALAELLAYRESADLKGLELLQTRLDTRRRQYRKAYEDLVAAASTEAQPLYNYRLFELSEAQWMALEEDAQQIFDEMMLQGINAGTPDYLLRQAIEARIPTQKETDLGKLTADVLSASLVPNLVPDERRTWEQAEQAVEQIPPVMLSVNEGDLIVRANETIDSSDFVLLDYFDLTERHFNWVGLCGFMLLIAAAVAFYLWVDYRQMNQLNQRDHFLVLLLCLVVALLAALNVPTVGLPAVGLLVGSFYGAPLGVTVVGLLTIILPVGTAVDAIPLITGALAAMLGTCIAPQLRSREEFALLGGVVGLSQAIVHLVLMLIRLTTVAAPLWKAVFVDSALHGLYGVAWSVVALGVSPYLEHFFDVVTPIRLAELANPNRPLLKRLAAEAPGTFQHTMFVANLAEAAARALGRNVELVRAGTLYHDIGKMHAPHGFIENQMGGPNLHDELQDPWESASIIKKHVTQGLVMARKYRLPQAVKAFIPEHQGDMKISYFYQQALEKQAKEPTLVVNESDFSYDGPTPQSPETGITMLADSCEAALRSLKQDASIDEAYGMVNKILRARWRNLQLVDSGLTREDMDIIASVFIQVWQQHNHKRIAYPKNAIATG